MPRVSRATSLGPQGFFGAYAPVNPTTGLTLLTLAVSGNGTLTTSIQAAFNFLWKRLSAQFDQSDWTFNIELSGLGRKLFDLPMRGALFFGEANAAGRASVWPYGQTLMPPQEVPANSNVLISVTNGTAGVLNVSFGLIGSHFR